MATEDTIRDNDDNPRDRLQRHTSSAIPPQGMPRYHQSAQDSTSSFNDECYSSNKTDAMNCVVEETADVGICYKLVDIEWCA